jgi:hypothetical protein
MFRLVARPAFQISLSTKFTFPGLTDGAIQIKQGVRRLLTRNGRIDAAVDRRGGKPGAGRLPSAAAMEAQRVLARVGAPDAGAWTSDADLRREAATAMRAVLGRGHAWVPEPD